MTELQYDALHIERLGDEIRLSLSLNGETVWIDIPRRLDEGDKLSFQLRGSIPATIT